MAVNLVELTAIYGTQPLDYALRNLDNCHFFDLRIYERATPYSNARSE
jgi:hypothetical protein